MTTTRSRRLRKMTDEEKFLFETTGQLAQDTDDRLSKRRDALEAKNKACPACLTMTEIRELTALRRGDFEEAEMILATERLLREVNKAAPTLNPV